MDAIQVHRIDRPPVVERFDALHFHSSLFTHSSNSSAIDTLLPSKHEWPAPATIRTVAFGMRAAIATASVADGTSKSRDPAINSVGAVISESLSQRSRSRINSSRRA